MARVCLMAVVTAMTLAASLSSAGAQTVSDHAENRDSRSRLVQKPGLTASQPVYAISTRHNNFVCKLAGDGWARGAFPSINAILDLSVAFSPQPDTTSYTIEPFLVSRDYTWSSGLTAHSDWFASADSALTAALFHFTNKGSHEVSLTVDQSGAFRVGHSDAAQVRPNNVGHMGASPLEIVATNEQFPDLFCKLRSNFPGSPSLIDTDTAKPVKIGTAAKLGYRQSGTLVIPPGGEADYFVALTGGRTGESEFPFKPTAKSLRSTLAAVRKWQAERIAHAPTLETPDEDINAFFLWNKIWPWRAERSLPLGEPYLLNSRDNARVRVMSAATGLNWDYYGIWANDCVQSLWECGALGHEFYPVISGTLETHFRHGAPESVELPLANGHPFYVFLKLASKPQWVMGAANYLLWSGDKAELARVWPQIRLTLQSFHAEFDYDRDWLDDYTTWPFPEQPNVGAYNHEMLYASCFWYAGFDAAARAARLFGRTAEAADLEWQRDNIRSAVNEKFATDYGYASWLDAAHAKDPHKGHNQVFPVQYGMASPAQARKVFDTELKAPVATEYGPSTLGTGDNAWVYNRWNMVHALYNYDNAEEAFGWLKKFVEQESNSACHYQGPEAYTPTGGITSQGLVWSSCRAMRAIYFGLVGISLDAEGVSFKPKPPAAWPGFTLNNLEVRGATINLRVRRGAASGATCDGHALVNGLVPNSMLTRGVHEVVVTLPRVPPDAPKP